jgi:hypothetical protein
MVYVNGKKFKIYELDSLDTFKNRLAYTLGTTESFLYFPNGIKYDDILNKKNNILVEDLLEKINKSARKNSSVTKLIKDIQTKVGKNKFARGKIIVKVWLYYNKKLIKEYKEQGKTSLDEIGDELKSDGIYISSRQIHTEWGEKDRIYKNEIQDRINSNIEKVNNTLEVFKEYRNIGESSAYTEFDIEHIEFILTLNLKKISLMEMFNSIQLNTMVPFATTNNLYKIKSSFIPPDEWNESDKDSLSLQVYQKNFTSTSNNVSNFESASITIDPDTKNIISTININPAKNNVTREEFTDRSISVFKGLGIKIKTVTESKVNGVFYMPLLSLNKYVFSDIVLNDEIFSRLITIDDHDKATKKMAGIYIHFEHPLTGYITARLTEKMMIKGDPTMKNFDLTLFEPGSPFIRVKISKANNKKSVEIFQEILGKLFQLYEDKKDGIINFYKNYIPDFGDVAPPEEDEIKPDKNTELAPDLFVTGYTTWCKPDRMPTIVSEEDAIKAKSKGKSILKFPRDVPDNPDAFKFPMDGVDQKHYVCNNTRFIYPGIKNNKLKNADIFPYVPCCFEKPQENKPKYLNYYEGKELITGENKQNNIIRTDKILKNDQFGTLPPNLENLFTIIDPNPNFEYARKGVFGKKNSFINVIMEALNEETNILNIEGEKQRDIALTKERLSYAKKKIAVLCRQELYDIDIKKILELIKDPDIYFDPNLFIHILEDKFDCNIYLFTRKLIDGEMTLPRHVQSYYKNRSKKRSIYVYEHMGSGSDRQDHPQCELIVKYDTTKNKDNAQYSFTYEESRNIRNVYSRLRKSYALNTVINESYLPLNDSVKIQSQWIDSYGKTRRINILYKDQKISLIITPIQPIKVKETTDRIIFLTTINTCMKLVESLKIEVLSQTVIGNVVKEINGVLGNVNISIPIKDGDIIDGLEEKQYGLSYPEKKSSLLTQYNENKKLARYLVEYVLWIYSHYLHDNGIVTIMDDNISQFAKDFFLIKSDYNYGHIEKIFNNDSRILIKGKIVVHNEETIKRLVYVLKLSIQRNMDSVMKYYERSVIQNYYVDITDFDPYVGQVILYGGESVEKWINENNIVYTIHDEVQIGLNTPYFFKNTLIDNNIYLAQNTQTLDKATDIAVKWVREGYNVGIYAESMTPLAFTLYSYINGTNIQKGTKIPGKPFSEEIKILGYKIYNNPEYTVLLSLN